jgi:hypothetical protein
MGDLENIMLSEISQLQKNKYCTIDSTHVKYPLIGGSHNHRNKAARRLPRAGQKGRGISV